MIRRRIALAIHQLNQQFALRIRQLLHAWRVLLAYAALHTLHVLVLSLLVWQRLQKLVGLYNYRIHLLGYGQHLLDISHKPVVSLPLASVGKYGLRIDIQRIQLNILYAVALVQHLAHLDHRHKRGRIHIHLAVFGVDTATAVVLRPC